MRAPGRAPAGRATTGSARKSCIVGFQRQQAAQFGGEVRVFAVQRGQVFFALPGRQLEQGVEQGRQPLPALDVHRGPRGRPTFGQAAGDSCSPDASRNIRAFCQSRRTLRSDRFSRAAISSSDRPAK
jgi:hypothetical protein